MPRPVVKGRKSLNEPKPSRTSGVRRRSPTNADYFLLYSNVGKLVTLSHTRPRGDTGLGPWRFERSGSIRTARNCFF